jgi:hypothetical protein
LKILKNFHHLNKYELEDWGYYLVVQQNVNENNSCPPDVRGQSSSSVPFNSNQNGDGSNDGDGDDDADDEVDVPDNVDDEDSSSIPSDFVTSNNFISTLPSHSYSSSLPSVPVVSNVSTVPSTSSASVVPAVPAFPKFQLTPELAALHYKDLIGTADK